MLPNVIYMVVGEDTEDADVEDLEGVTWSSERIYDTDVMFVKVDENGLTKDEGWNI